MKVIAFLTACSLLFPFAAGLSADVPDLVDKGAIQLGGSTIQYTPYPTVVDWNNDGMKDLLVGAFYNGNIHLFLNEGTNLNPVFNSSSLVESGGTAITTTYG